METRANRVLSLQGEVPDPRVRASCERHRQSSSPRVPKQRVVEGPRERWFLWEGRVDLGREAADGFAGVPVPIERGGRRAEGKVNGGADGAKVALDRPESPWIVHRELDLES